ncbi:MAG: EpsG family protein, partial [Lachnospiraceae bacterium]|nr:EpsG family protein [Lachnospiraceae bacterium]
AFFSILTVLFFCLALHEQSASFLFSLYLLLTGGYYFNSLNSVRYYLALAIALYAMRFCMEQRYLAFFFWILLGANFHKSILLVIPVYLTALFLSRVRLRKWMLIPLAAFLLSLLFAQDLYRELIFRFYPYYRDSAFDVANISYGNLAKCGATLLMTVLFGREAWKKDAAVRFYLLLNLMGLVVVCCGSFVPEASRIAYYMIISQVFLLPRVILLLPEEGKTLGIPNPVLRKLLSAGVVLAFALFFAFFLRRMYDIDIRLLPYRNWIFQ